MKRKWAFRCAAAGAGVPFLLMGGEFVKRLNHALRGLQGESALWGEPLFYIFILSIPLTVIGFIVGMILDANTQSD